MARSTLLFFFSILFFSSAVSTVFSYNLITLHEIQNYNELLLSKVNGPESIAFDCKAGGPYVSISDGRILKWQPRYQNLKEFAFTVPNRTRTLCDGSTDPNMEPVCGRPLGLRFDTATCELYIADAYFGLQKVGPHGGVAQQLATSADGIPFTFTNGFVGQ